MLSTNQAAAAEYQSGEMDSPYALATHTRQMVLRYFSPGALTSSAEVRSGMFTLPSLLIVVFSVLLLLLGGTSSAPSTSHGSQYVRNNIIQIDDIEQCLVNSLSRSYTCDHLALSVIKSISNIA